MKQTPARILHLYMEGLKHYKTAGTLEGLPQETLEILKIEPEFRPKYRIETQNGETTYHEQFDAAGNLITEPNPFVGRLNVPGSVRSSLNRLYTFEHCAAARAALRFINRELTHHDALKSLGQDPEFLKNRINERDIKYAAERGQLHEIPTQFLTVENLTAIWARDPSGDLPVHTVAHKRQLKCIPSEVLKEIIHCENIYGATPLSIAIEKETLDQIPPELLTWENLQKRGRDGKTVRAHLSPKALAQLPSNPLMIKAKEGTLAQQPIEELRKWLFVTDPQVSHTPFLEAAFKGHLGSLPREFLTKENLSDTSYAFERSILHVNKNLNFPPGILTDELLLTEDEDGVTVLEIHLLRRQKPHNLNPKLISQRSLKTIREDFQNSENPRRIGFLRALASWQKNTPEGARLLEALDIYTQTRKVDPAEIEAITRRLFKGKAPTELERAKAKWASHTAEGAELLDALKAYDSIHKEPPKKARVQKADR